MLYIISCMFYVRSVQSPLTTNRI